MIAPPGVDLLHRPVAALVRTYGTPTSATSKDDGQHVTFADGTLSLDTVIDDDGVVHAFDVVLPAGTTYSLNFFDGKTHRLVFGTTTSVAARDELASVAETEGGTFRVFQRGPDSDVVLTFDPKTSTLSHVIVGDRATLLRLGYLRDPRPLQPTFPYVAPKVKKSAVSEGTGPQATVVRVDLDRGGAVRNVAVVVPSNDPSFDADLVKRVAHDAYAPATLGGRTIGASVLREVRH